MDVEIISQRDNSLLERKEVRFRVSYPGAGVPERQEVRSKLIAVLDASKDLTVLDHLKPEYGRNSAVGYVKIYANADAMKAEPAYMNKRNFAPKEKKAAAESAPVAEKKEGK
ncbi:MAG: 30S ribosomal protein S24e [Candidatus Altiarchaeota archaeon]|nr:30S ribosomal protein S24e [Candidatus Altiarchaeota archaeon]